MSISLDRHLIESKRDSQLPSITIGFVHSRLEGLHTLFKKIQFIFQYLLYSTCINQKKRATKPVISPLIPSKNLVSYHTLKTCLASFSPKKMEKIEEKTIYNRLEHSPYLYPSQQCLGMATHFLATFKNSTQASFKEKVIEAGEVLKEGATWDSVRAQSVYEVKLGAQGHCRVQDIGFYRQLMAQAHQQSISCDWQAKKVHFLQTKRTQQEQDLFATIQNIFSQSIHPLTIKDKILEELGQKYPRLEPSIYGLILEIEAEFQFLQHPDRPRYDQLHLEATEAACQLQQLHIHSHQNLEKSADILHQLTALSAGSYLVQFPRHTIAYVRDTSGERVLFDANKGTFYPSQEQEERLLKELITEYTSHSSLGVKILLI